MAQSPRLAAGDPVPEFEFQLHRMLGLFFFFSLNVVTFAKLLQRVPHVSHF